MRKGGMRREEGGRGGRGEKEGKGLGMREEIG